jgi:hypothetical protein
MPNDHVQAPCPCLCAYTFVSMVTSVPVSVSVRVHVHVLVRLRVHTFPHPCPYYRPCLCPFNRSCSCAPLFLFPFISPPISLPSVSPLRLFFRLSLYFSRLSVPSLPLCLSHLYLWSSVSPLCLFTAGYFPLYLSLRLFSFVSPLCHVLSVCLLLPSFRLFSSIFCLIYFRR